jgi:LmbE family N-acetylglucosaminyl deacetylase
MFKKRIVSATVALLAVPLFIMQTAAFRGDAPADVRAATDRDTYNVGDEVWLEIAFPSSEAVRTLDGLLLTVRYAGEEKPVLDRVILGAATRDSLTPNSTGYHSFWKIPLEARAGRYEIDLRVQDPKSHSTLQDIPHLASFVVHRKLVQISSLELGQSYYTSGEAVSCGVRIENLSDRPLDGLRVEFSERYWPWIVQQTERVGSNIETLRSDLVLQPHQRASVESPRCAVAKSVEQPALQQFAAAVWDHDRKNVYEIAISPLVFVHPTGVETPQPYPPQFTYPDLKALNTIAYRAFPPPDPSGGAIVFDREHTMFPAGADAKVSFTLRNPSDQPWTGVKLRARLLSSENAGLGEKVLAEHLELTPRGSPLKEEVTFKLPDGPAALFRVRVEVEGGSGQVLAANDLEIAANPLPQSVLIFCAHEDDEGSWFGLIRAAVENQVPIRVIYFTSGDTGSCDRYFQHTCGPEEALHFGALRMEEARATLGHLGVAREDIYFLGLPDGGSGKIWYEHPDESHPYLSVLLASDHAPYEGLVRPNLPYARQTVVETAKELIRKFLPQVIVAAHPPAEGHIDHVVNGYFAVKALQELSREGALPSGTELRVDRIYNPKDHPPTPYHYEERTFAVSGEAAARAQEAGWYYQSQGGNRSQGNVRSFTQLPRTQTYRVVLDWKEHEGWNEKE